MAGKTVRSVKPVFGLLAIVLMMVPPAEAADRLGPGAVLTPGAYLASASGQFRCHLQPDGNLVVYQGNQPIWHTGTAGQPIVRAVMQPDGNFVLVRNDGRPAWWTQTSGFPNAVLVLHDNGALVIYQGNRAIWGTQGQTVPSGSREPAGGSKSPTR